MKSLGEGSFLEKEFLQKLPRSIPVLTHVFFFVDWSPHVEIYYKGIMMLLPLNYWWKGLSVWWSCFFNDRWFDKEQALCIALNSLAKSERGLTGRRNSVEHGNFSGIWFHVKGFVYDNHMPATFLLTASCCVQIREQFLTCRFQVTISISTWLFFDTVHLMKNLKNICLIERNFSSGLYINSEALPNPILVDGEVSWSLLHQV